MATFVNKKFEYNFKTVYLHKKAKSTIDQCMYFLHWSKSAFLIFEIMQAKLTLLQ